MRTVYLEPLWKFALSYRDLVRYPPQGYRFVTRTRVDDALISFAGRYPIAYSLQYALDRAAPIHLLKSCWDVLKRPPGGTALTYSDTHLVLRKEPWVLDLETEHVANVLGGYRHLRRFRGLLRTALASHWCRKIIVRMEAARTALKACLGPSLAEKTEVVSWAVPSKRFAKSFNDSKVKLLFVNSANIPGQFHYKGGKEALEAFLLLRQRYPRLEMTMRSDIPRPIQERYRQIENLRLIDEVIGWEELEQEFLTADIFLLPSHITPGMVFLDALSYELPIVTTDVWGNPETVRDGLTGLLVHDAPVALHYQRLLPRHFAPPVGSPEYDEIVAATNRQMVQELVEKLSLLIEDAELRRRLGRAARYEAEQGRFSLEERNRKLKRILDEAVGVPDPGK